jgi:hypothetical protein
MEIPQHAPELVHVLRHSFRPSEQLGRALSNFLPLESKRPTSFLEIKSLGMLALDAFSHASHAYTMQLIEARKAVEKSQGQSLAVIPDIEIRNVNENCIDILMGVQNRPAMYVLSRNTKHLLPEAISMRDNADPKFSVFARINSSVPITASLQAQAVDQFNDTYQQLGSKYLLNIFPEGISGKDQYVRMKRPDLNDSHQQTA